MKLYYTPGACSQAPHIALREAGVDFTWEKVDLKEKKTESGNNFLEVNPKGYVPALEVAPGKVMTELAVLLQYVADQVPAKKLAPPPASPERYDLQTWLTFVSTELHKGLSPLFNPGLNDESKQALKPKLFLRLDYVNGILGKRDTLLESGFSMADIYLFVILGWTPRVSIDLATKWPALVAFRERLLQRPAVQETLKVEGFLK